MTACVAYYFAYVPRKPKKLPATIAIQISLVNQFAAASALDPVEKFVALLTNRDRHFANTSEFRDAVERARVLGCAVVMADIEALLSRTDPKLLKDCASTLFNSNVQILDARKGIPFSLNAFVDALKRAHREGQSKREVISAGLQLSPAERSNVGKNQPKAADGAVRKADHRAEKVRPIVEGILGALPPGAKVTPTALANELNSRGVLTDRGNTWSRTTADRILKRLAQLKATRTT